jgi:hypothetical protein
MLSPIDAAVVRKLKHPGLEAAALGIELPYGPKQIEEDLLNRFFRFPIVPDNHSSNVENQGTVAFEQNGESVVATIAQ